MIIFNGVSSDEVGVIVEHYPRVVFPKRRTNTFQIPGRNGDLIIDDEVYDNYDQQYEIFIDAKDRGGLEAAMPRLASWLLSGTGYCRLEDSYFPEFFRMAYVPEAHEFLSYFNEYGRGTLTFNCAPERWYKSGEVEIEVQNGQVLHNPSGFRAWPILRAGESGTNLTIRHIGEEFVLLNNGPVIIRPEYDVNYHSVIDGYDHKTASYTFQFGSGYGKTYLDTKEHIYYRVMQVGGTSSAYNIVDTTVDLNCEFGLMYLGKETELTWDNNAKLYITPRWWTV